MPIGWRDSLSVQVLTTIVRPMGYRTTVDGEVCISSGRCVAERPDVFRFDDEEVAEVIPGAAPPPDQEQLDLARACPSGALQVVDAGTGEEIDIF